MTLEDIAAANEWQNYGTLPEAFAAHRQAAERKVVEFVRAKHHPNGGHAFYKVIADAIERGEHLK